MKWSEFNIHITSPNKTIFIKSLKTQEVGEFPPELNLRGETFNSGQVPETLSPYFNDMLEMGLIVHNNTNEAQEFLNTFHNDRKKMDVLSVVFTPTLKCQDSCFYCWQEQFRKGNAMTTETANLFIARLIDHFQAFPEIKKLAIELFGGEPLLAWDIITYTLPRAQKICEQYDVELETSIITNTEYLDLNKAKFLHQFNWTQIQTTFEGPPDVHDAIRIPKSKHPTFWNTFNNVEILLNSNYAPPSTKMRCHLYSMFVNRVSELFDLFVEHEFHENPHFRVVLNEVQATNAPQLPPEMIGEKFEPLTETKLAKAFLQGYREMAARGIKKVPYTHIDGPLCYEKRYAAWMVAPDGVIESCDSRVGIAKGYAHLKQSLPIINNQPDTNFRYLDQCNEEKCEQRYVCGGSCTYNAMVETGNWFDRWCRKEFLTQINKDLLWLHHVEYPNDKL